MKWFPNFLTICNLLCGCAAILFALQGMFTVTFWLIIAAAVFDFCDGFAARLFKAYSPMGKELDSLADMVSFGVAPAMAVFSLLQIHVSGSAIPVPIYAYAAFLLAAFAALRLAKFNIDTRQSEEFLGLPTPAMSLFFVSYVVSYNEVIASDSPMKIYVTLALVALFSAAMVCEVPMFSFKFKTFGLRENLLRYFFALFAVIMVVVFGYAAPALIIIAYVLLSSALAVVNMKKV